MIKVRVPATSANVGPGFDSFGIAFDLYNYVECEEIESGLEIILKNPQKGDNMYKNKTNMVYRAMGEVFKLSNYTPKGIRIIQESNIPRARGLGSSAACIIGGVILANEIADRPFSQGELLNIAAKMEGHADNVTAAMYGGFNIAFVKRDSVYSSKTDIKEKLMFALLVPEYKLLTSKSRKSLPDMVSMKDAVSNISRGAMLAMAFEKDDFDMLPFLLEDRLHEKYRKVAIKGADTIIQAANKFGAYATYIGGSGPTLVSVIPPDNIKKFEFLINNFFMANKFEWTVKLVHSDNQGAVIV